ncbi:hypothetical protein [Paraliomyxa miuraensis]|uniref:hypothetical protein n=1 Tax=Paraliomyxa miuraensis TaxID=376150 RepID=UPI00225B69FC|nr:hypothetical protein [Paraliomyxa miuraensis]MCX4245423.1 hypothetical protein [Paraliomyxa miuraensis]
MHRIDGLARIASLLVGVAALLGCPGSPIVPSDTESGTTDEPTSTGPGEVCTPGQDQPCACPDGTDGTMTCRLDGSGFDACECEGGTIDEGTTTSDTTTSEDTTGTTGPDVECMTDEDCAGLSVQECEVPECDERGVCVPAPAPFDTPCGDPTENACTAPDSCNNSGTCLDNHVEEGLACECPTGSCTCSAGVCGECNVRAATNNFTTIRSIEGWELTGSWGLHRQAPQSELQPAMEFPGQVLGSNGNRVAPFPGNEVETSYARTAPTELPAEIIFLSWHVDQGGGAADNKTVRVSVDGGATWDTLADCAVDPGVPFCSFSMDQDIGAFYLVQLPVPPALQGQMGIVEFGYDTVDACCEFERGWYIDSLNVATECLCVADSDCAAYGTACGTGVCAISGECGLTGMPEGTACGDPFENDCNGADGCDGVGYCRDNLQATGLSYCGDCPGGLGCSFCEDGQCLDCLAYTDFSDFSDPLGVAGWNVISLVGTADWGLYDGAGQSSSNAAVAFPNAPVYGTDGNLQMPYPGDETEDSQVITSVGLVGPTLTFLSWNVDEGAFVDGKRIELSVDGGATWNMLVDCQGAGGQPFCNFVPGPRAGTDWDMISIDTSTWQGMAGQLRFTYETLDSCCGFEQGWYIDDLSFAAFCADEPFGP